MALRPSLRRSAARPKSLTQNLRRLILRWILRKEGRFRGYMDIRSQLFRMVVATVGSMILGSLWYSPLLFSGLWLRLIGKTSDEIREQGGMIKGDCDFHHRRANHGLRPRAGHQGHGVHVVGRRFAGCAMDLAWIRRHLQRSRVCVSTAANTAVDARERQSSALVSRYGNSDRSVAVAV